MKFAGEYLLALDVWISEKSIGMHPLEMDPIDNSVYDQAVMFRVAPNNMAGSRAISRFLRPQLPDFWAGLIKNVYCWYSGFYNYQFTYIAIRLAPDGILAMIDLAKSDGHRYGELQHELLDPIFQGLRRGVAAWRASWWKSYPSAVVGWPLAELSAATEQEVVCTLWERVGKTAVLPVRVTDMVVLPGLNGVPHTSATLIRDRQFPYVSRAKEICIPITGLDFLVVAGFIKIFTHMLEGMDELNILKYSSIASYILPYDNSVNLLSWYQNKFLKDKEVTYSRSESLSDMLSAYEQEMNFNQFYTSLENPVSLIEPRRPYDVSFVRYLRGDVREAVLRVERRREKANQRIDILERHLKDAVDIASMRTSIALDRSIRRYTIVTLVITLLALFVAIVSLLASVA